MISTFGGTTMRKFIMLAAVCLLLGADDPQDAAKKDLMKLQGEWSMVSGRRDGQAVPKDVLAGAKRVCKEDELTVTVDDTVYMKAKIVVDPTKKPKAIDYTVTEGDNKGKKVFGIYEVDGDTVKFNLAGPDKERPKDFTADKGSGCTYTVWKRKGK
jgi:uncharacterized protein (TIGR03067 family)